MQDAVALPKSSINSKLATFAVLLVLTVGGAGGYWFKSQLASTAAPVSAQKTVAGQARHVAPPVDWPEETVAPRLTSSSRTGD